MIAQSQIREKISRYLRHEISLDQFEDWLVQRSWNMHKDSDEDAQRLASEVELRLAEHSSGHLTVAALRDELRDFANVFPSRIDFGSVPDEPVKFTQDNKTLDAVLPVFMCAAPVQTDQPNLVYLASAPVGT